MKHALIKLTLAMGVGACMILVPATASQAAALSPPSTQSSAQFWHYLGQYPTREAAFRALIAQCRRTPTMVGDKIERIYSNGAVAFVAYYLLANGHRTVDNAADRCNFVHP